MRNAALIALLVTVLAVLAVLQYRWIGDVSAAEEHRARTAMDTAARHFNEEIERELSRTTGIFQRAQLDAFDIERLRQEWAETTRDPRLIAHLWLIDEEVGEYPLLYSVEGGEFVAVEQAPKQLKPIISMPAMVDPQGRPGPARLPFVGEVPALDMVPIRSREMIRERLFEGGFPPMGGGAPRRRTFLVLEVDRDYLTRQLFPALARDFFGDGYAVAVSDGRSIVYRSDARWPAEGSPPDAQLPLIRLGGVRVRPVGPAVEGTR